MADWLLQAHLLYHTLYLKSMLLCHLAYPPSLICGSLVLRFRKDLHHNPTLRVKGIIDSLLIYHLFKHMYWTYPIIFIITITTIIMCEAPGRLWSISIEHRHIPFLHVPRNLEEILKMDTTLKDRYRR